MDIMPCMKSELIQQKYRIERLPVAAYNPSPKWLGGYFEVLAEAGVAEWQHSFYAPWVRQFFNRNPGKARHSLGVREMACFLADPAWKPGVPAAGCRVGP